MKIKCKVCGEELEAESSLKKETVEIEGKKLYVTYFKCTKCAKNHIVQLDDDNTLKLLDEIGDLLKYLYKCNMEYKTPKKRKSKKVKSTNKALKRMRKDLVDMFTGKTIYLNGEVLDIVVEMQE